MTARLGAIVAGGRATRFGGDKGAALLHGTALIDRAAALIRSHVDAIVVVGRDWPGLTRIDDSPRPGLGPLGGICGAIGHASEIGFGEVLTIAGDMPHVPAELIARLCAASPAFCADAPILGCWTTAMLGPLLARLGDVSDNADKRPELSIRRWAIAAGARAVAAPAPLPNVNTPADLASL